MTDIKELADKIIKEVWQSPHAMTAGLHADLTQFAHRLIAAYCAEPVAWYDDQYHDFSHVERLGWKPLFLAPPLTEQVSWGIDWGKHGDRTCASIVKKHADGKLEVIACEYSPLTEPAPSEFGTEQRDKDWSAIKDAAPTIPLHAPSEANWGEDFEHENGQYQCLCCKCGQIFIGHKRRVVCKLCVGAAHTMWDKPPEEWTRLERVATPSSDEAARLARRLHEWALPDPHDEREVMNAPLLRKAANLIERLAAVNTNLNSENALLLKWKQEGVPEGCVVVRREITEDAKCILATAGNYRTYRDQWAALIAAGEVK